MIILYFSPSIYSNPLFQTLPNSLLTSSMFLIPHLSVSFPLSQSRSPTLYLSLSLLVSLSLTHTLSYISLSLSYSLSLFLSLSLSLPLSLSLSLSRWMQGMVKELTLRDLPQLLLKPDSSRLSSYVCMTVRVSSCPFLSVRTKHRFVQYTC